MRLVMLIENTAISSKLYVEHGMSVFIEHGDEYFLFDTGADSRLINNAKRMHLKIDRVKKVMLSHNHLAHTGGIQSLLQLNPNMRFFALKAVQCHPARKRGLISVSLGDLAERIAQKRDNFILFKQFQEVSDGVFLLKDEVRDERWVSPDKLRLKVGDSFENDEFEHESFAVLFPSSDRSKGCVILGGCCHTGLPNMIRTVRQNWPESPILAAVVGMHFMGSTAKKLSVSPDFIEQTAKEIRRLGIGSIYVCHCTGLAGYEELKKHLGDQVQYLQTGEELSF